MFNNTLHYINKKLKFERENANNSRTYGFGKLRIEYDLNNALQLHNLIIIELIILAINIKKVQLFDYRCNITLNFDIFIM